MLRGTAWLTFVYHVLARGEVFVGAYNEALADYRQEQDIASTSRPMPTDEL